MGEHQTSTNTINYDLMSVDMESTTIMVLQWYWLRKEDVDTGGIIMCLSVLVYGICLWYSPSNSLCFLSLYPIVPHLHLSLQRFYSPRLLNLALVIEMSKRRGTPHRGSNGQGKPQHDLSLMVEEGYEAGISMPVYVLIDDQEAQLVNEHLAMGKWGRKINR